MSRTKRLKVLKLNVDLFVTEDEWNLVNLILDEGVKPTFAEAFEHQKQHGDINEVLDLPWRFVARFFDVSFGGMCERFEDNMLDRHNDGAY